VLRRLCVVRFAGHALGFERLPRLPPANLGQPELCPECGRTVSSSYACSDHTPAVPAAPTLGSVRLGASAEASTMQSNAR
jgi:hypothetical protein